MPVPEPSKYPDPGPPRRPLLTILRPLLWAGWAIAAIRLLLDAFAPDVSMYFGVYYGMPLVLVVAAFKGWLDDLTMPRFLLGMGVTALLVWGIPDVIAYG